MEVLKSYDLHHQTIMELLANVLLIFGFMKFNY